MSFDGLFTGLPNEMLRLVLSHLFPKRLRGVMRVNAMWAYLSRSGLITPAMRTLEEKYPFLITEEVLETFTNSEYDALLEKEEKVYDALSNTTGVPRHLLERKQLEILSDREEEDFYPTLAQRNILKVLRVASDVIKDDEGGDRQKVCIMMARIGNAQKMRSWIEKNRKEEPNELHWGEALQWAAMGGARSMREVFN